MDKNDPEGIQNIKKMYEKMTYFDQYGGSVILCIIITIILIIMVSYCFIMINAQPIIDDWTNQRCKPNIIPIAGFITHPDGISATDYTYQNFTYCTQNILSSITGAAVQPLTFVTSLLNNMAQQVDTDIQSVRAMFDKVRTSFQDVSQEIMGRILNMTIPLQQIVIAVKDLISKIQGVMTSGLYTVLGSYYTLKSLMGAIAQFIITILIALAAMIAVFWAVPFTWGFAIANTVIFVAIAIPMAIILAFMVDVLHVQTNLKLPKVKCFDEGTLIMLNDGTQKRIDDIVVGDVLMNNNTVTACIKVETKGSDLYNLNGVIVSDSHIVQCKDKWIRVSQHPDSIRLNSYDKPYLYCLNTSHKIIRVNDTVFTDWDEVYGDDLANSRVASFIGGGFAGHTKIKMQNGSEKEISNICVGDILENGENVYGIVMIDGRTNKHYEYNLGNHLVVEGGSNLVICNQTNTNIEKRKILDNHCELYHLLTDTKTFTLGTIKFYDYNAAMDLFLDKTKGKLLSAKYV